MWDGEGGRCLGVQIKGKWQEEQKIREVMEEREGLALLITRPH